MVHQKRSSLQAFVVVSSLNKRMQWPEFKQKCPVMYEKYKAPSSDLNYSKSKRCISFVFLVEDNKIVAEKYMISGTERVYVNNMLIYEGNKFSRNTSHTFLVDGTEYVVVFSYRNLRENSILCKLKAEGIILKQYRCNIKNSKKAFVYSAVMLTPLVYGLGYLKSHYGLPDEVDYVVYGLISTIILGAIWYSVSNSSLEILEE